MVRQFLLIVIGCLTLAPAAWSVDHIELRRDGHDLKISGQVLVTATDGGMLLLAPDGEMWAVQPDEVVRRQRDETEFVPLGREELSKQLLKDLPAGFDVYHTKHYLICYQTSREYAAWCGALFERLYRGFINFWSRQGIKLHDPKFPLVAVVFGDRGSYAKYAAPEVGKAADSIVGYYNLQSNRMATYDLTGVQAVRDTRDRRGSADEINAVLSRPQAEPLVATTIHEATHQIAYNSGLLMRFADIPLWVNEGIAVYFETPDLENPKGWRTIGAVNWTRLERFREYLARRPANSLETLLTDDKRFREPKSALDAYAEAWALNYYLIRNHTKKYVSYLKKLAQKQPLIWDEPATRLQEFRAVFGDDLSALDADFLRQMQKVQ